MASCGQDCPPFEFLNVLFHYGSVKGHRHHAFTSQKHRKTIEEHGRMRYNKMNKDKNASSMKKDEQGSNEGNKLGRNRKNGWKWKDMLFCHVLSWSSNVEQLIRITLATKPRRRNRPSRPIHQQHAWLGVSDVSQLWSRRKLFLFRISS